MPVTYRIDATRHLLRTVCTGRVNLVEVMDHFRQLKEDPACLGRMDVLLDVTNVDSLPDSNQIGAVGTAVGAIRPKVQFGACSIVAAKDAMFGMMRMFEVRAGDYFGAVRVFRKAADAETWLASQQARTKSRE
jgi:hypothetical protein